MLTFIPKKNFPMVEKPKKAKENFKFFKKKSNSPLHVTIDDLKGYLFKA